MVNDRDRFHGEGQRLAPSVLPPLTLTLSPRAQNAGRGNSPTLLGSGYLSPKGEATCDQRARGTVHAAR